MRLPHRPLAAALSLLLPWVAACGDSGGRPPRQPVPVTVAAATVAPAPYVVTADGTVEPLQTVQVESQVGGVLLSVDFTEGQEVTKGQPLFHIDARPYQATLRQAEANLARDEAQAINSRRDAERYQKLVELDYVTRSQADQAEATARAQAAAVKADSAAVENARLNLSYTVIPAPISGRTGAVLVRQGNLVKPNAATPLVIINQIRPILVRFAIPGRVLPLVQKHGAGTPLAVTVVAAEGEEGGEPIEETGELTFIDNAVDAATGTVLLKGRFANRDRALWPGEYVSVRLQVYVQPDALLVPQAAPVTEQDGSFVFVVDEAGTAHRRKVELGRTLGDQVIVDRGLEPGERVVTDGQSRLAEGATVQVRGAAGEVAGERPTVGDGAAAADSGVGGGS